MTREECLRRALAARAECARAEDRAELMAKRYGTSDMLYQVAASDVARQSDRVKAWERLSQGKPLNRRAPQEAQIPFFLLKQAI